MDTGHLVCRLEWCDSNDHYTDVHCTRMVGTAKCKDRFVHSASAEPTRQNGSFDFSHFGWPGSGTFFCRLLELDTITAFFVLKQSIMVKRNWTTVHRRG